MQSAVIAWVASPSLKLSLILPPDGMMTLLIVAVTPLAYFHLRLKAPNASLCSVTQMLCGGWVVVVVVWQCFDETLLDHLSPTSDDCQPCHQDFPQ